MLLFFKPGDEVMHMNGARGRVVAIVDRFGVPGVDVEFGPAPGDRQPKRKWRGCYDQAWLTQHPDGLRLVNENS